MIIKKISRAGYDCCNFCTIRKSSYAFVYELSRSGSNGGMKATICPSCANQFKEIIVGIGI